MADESVPIRRQSWQARAWFIFKRGVLGWGVLMAGARFWHEFYTEGQWPPLSELGLMMAVFGIGGIFVGAQHMQTEKFHDPVRRCAECGEALPKHTGWCVASK